MNEQTLQELIARHETILNRVIERADIPATKIKDAIRYSLFPGGKRLRPMLIYLVGTMIHASLDSLDYIAAAIEITHCYSLIHDDLPAMDNDDIRRGKPSCHCAFDEATAILAGDGMQALAIEILFTHLPRHLSESKTIMIAKELVKASGPSGMVSGQALDLTELSNPNIDEINLSRIHQLKTGKLIRACVLAALAAGTPTAEEARALERFANHFGLLFQMQDDYLDRYQSKNLGKGRSSDLANKKVTYATLFKQHDLIQKISEHYDKTFNALSCFGNRAKTILGILHELKQNIK
ncbi:polyprenyl synthetase family protein [Legionella yabuuchiae]|uniref:polyprenyl synthetase family protein n=1 Tax=Legionella yabuuchiae TaxID=376727 RepID=UPI001054D170|nr:polyprenyl synthetase family protein [Legionella yabuuchiae]